MATYLETYKTKALAYQDLLAHGQALNGQQLCSYLEIMYRIHVFETFSLLEHTCPQPDNKSAFQLHYQLVFSILASILEERRFEIYTDKKIKEEQSTSYKSCFTFFNDFSKQCTTCTEQEYPDTLHRVLYSFCCAWLQYRNTIIDLDLQYTKLSEEVTKS